MCCDLSRKDKKIALAFAFIMPILLALPAFAAVGVYPFGDKSMLIIDMNNEYVDYLAQMNESLRSSGSFFRSWNMGMGLNMLGLIAFYTSSPFNLLVLLMPLAYITEVIFAVTMLKLGLAGFLFALFATEIFPNAGRIFHVIFSVAYALSAYNIAYSSNIMWLDGSAFLPLVLLGAERILRFGRYRLFIYSLIYVFFTSYYIGYMIGAFSFLYLTASYFASQNDVRAYARVLWRFLGSAALAAGCCAFLLMPAFFNLRDGQSAMWDIGFEPRLRYSLIQLSAKLLPGVYDTLTDSGLPNIYCTVFAVAMCFLYFCTKAVPMREKLIFGGLLGFLPLSFSCEILDLAWHAFEEPTWFPARYSFIFSFLILYLALRCAVLLKQILWWEVSAAAALPALLIIEISINRYWFMRLRESVISLIFVCFYAIILILCKGKNRHTAMAALVFLVCMESFYNAAFVVRGMDEQFEYKSRSEYQSFMQSYGDAANELKKLDSGVYRAEILGQRNANGAMALGYNSISHYSTTTDQALNEFLRDLGYNTGTINELRFAESTALTNGMLGIKYVLSPYKLPDAYILRKSVGDIGIYENSAAWPLAFWAPDTAASFVPEPEHGPFEMQNGFIRAFTDSNIAAFSPISISFSSFSNISLIDYGNHIEYTRPLRNQSGMIDFKIINPNRNEAFAFFPVYGRHFSSSEIIVDGKSRGYDFGYLANTVIPLGNADDAVLRIVSNGEGLRVSNEYFAALDIAAAINAAQITSERRFKFTEFSDTSVAGKITAPEYGILATTFPYDEGWTLKIDGNNTKPIRLSGVFLAIPVSEGEHVITMRYIPPGFCQGVAISIITVISMIFFRIRQNGFGSVDAR